MRGWRLGRVVPVVARGFSSDENLRYLTRAGGHWIAGERMRDGSPDAHAALNALLHGHQLGRAADRDFRSARRNPSVKGLPIGPVRYPSGTCLAGAFRDQNMKSLFCRGFAMPEEGLEPPTRGL